MSNVQPDFSNLSVSFLIDASTWALVDKSSHDTRTIMICIKPFNYIVNFNSQWGGNNELEAERFPGLKKEFLVSYEYLLNAQNHSFLSEMIKSEITKDLSAMGINEKVVEQYCHWLLTEMIDMPVEEPEYTETSILSTEHFNSFKLPPQPWINNSSKEYWGIPPFSDKKSDPADWSKFKAEWSKYHKVYEDEYMNSVKNQPRRPSELDNFDFLQKQVLLPRGVLRPIVGDYTDEGTVTLERAIILLNDREGWTREQIADWIETLDIDTRLEPINENN